MALSLLLLVFISALADGQYFNTRYSYVLLPMDMSFLGSHRQYFHIYITSWTDTEVEITLPDSPERGPYYTEHVVLSKNNTWAWRQIYRLSDNLLTKAVSRGFRVISSAPIIAYALRYSSYGFTYLTAYHALPLTSGDTTVVLGTYQGRMKTKGYSSFYVICSWENPTNYTAYRYDVTNGVPSTVKSGALEPYQSITQMELNGDRLIGLLVNFSEPISVFAGNQRNEIPWMSPFYRDAYYAKPLFQQIPPISRLGTEYVIGPVPGRFGHTPKYPILVTFPYADTELEIGYDADFGDVVKVRNSRGAWATTRFSGRMVISSSGSDTKGSYLELENVHSHLPVVLRCTKPCFPTLLKYTDTSGFQQTSGYMSVVAPPARIPVPLRIFVPGQLEEDLLDDTYLVLATEADRRTISLDGVPLAQYRAIGSCNVSYVNAWSVTSCRLPYGVHVIDDVDDHVTMAVHVHGNALKQECTTCYSSSYGFPAFYPGEIYTELNIKPRSRDGETSTDGVPTTSYTSDVSVTDVVILASVIMLIVVVCCFMLLVVSLTREFRSSRRRCSMPDPSSPSAPDHRHLYLCPTSNNFHNYCYSASVPSETSRTTLAAEDGLYCDVSTSH